jgi:hypothetical protein
MSRHFEDWIQSYIDYASGPSEAPPYMHFWSGVSAISGALRRRVWIDMKHFKWHCNHYIVIVAPPGIVSKSTTTAIAMDLLRKVPGVNFGPEVVTWPALVTAFAACHEQFDWPKGSGDWYGQCALTLESSEFGNLVNPQDREMIDLLVTLWDSKQGAFKKVTKGSGNDTVENPWINLIACTTPAWIAGNFPEYVIGGGFTSRCLFVYCEEKFKRLAYPDEAAPPGFFEVKKKLVEDLSHIATSLVGPFTLTDRARDWGHAWYNHHYDHPPEALSGDRFGGYLARKQTHIHKLSMILSAATRDDLVITEQELSIADKQISDLEASMPKVFSKIGRTEESIQTERLLKFIEKRGKVTYAQAYQEVYLHFPQVKNFEGIIKGGVDAGFIKLTPGNPVMITWVKV